MERLKQMGLKQAFFCLTFFFLIIAIVLSVLSFVGGSKWLEKNSSQITVEINHGKFVAVAPNEQGTVSNPSILKFRLVEILQILLPILIIISGLFIADILFYRLKLKQPLANLQAGAERIMQNDLDIEIPQTSNDELGQLCRAFEAMRCALVSNNQEMWRQMEERKRLNAAFSHDLRNPVMVLKGSTKILRKGLSPHMSQLPLQVTIEDTLSLIEEYTARIETYIEAMSSAQRLEELTSTPVQVEWQSLVQELSDSLNILGLGSKLNIHVLTKDSAQISSILVDKGIVYNVAENMVTNAIRYASTYIQVELVIVDEQLTITVQDDGPGFPQKIVSRGAEPFLRGDEQNEHKSHLGMGLYICRLLCEKHGGTLSLQNTRIGALTAASFFVGKA
jgi:signal transduction histidine kinase